MLFSRGTEMYVDIANLDIENVDEFDLREEIHHWLNKKQCRIVRRYDGMYWYSDDIPFREAIKLESLGIEYQIDDTMKMKRRLDTSTVHSRTVYDEAVELLEILEG
jgi:hypothetical protein